MSVNKNQVDIIHCEAASESYQGLDLHHEASRDGTRSLRISSGACMIGDGVRCTQVILYVNLTFYDQRNRSVIPVCGFRKRDHNSECYCIHYLTLGKTNTPTLCSRSMCNQYVHNGRCLMIGLNLLLQRSSPSTFEFSFLIWRGEPAAGNEAKGLACVQFETVKVASLYSSCIVLSCSNHHLY